MNLEKRLQLLSIGMLPEDDEEVFELLGFIEDVGIKHDVARHSRENMSKLLFGKICGYGARFGKLSSEMQKYFDSFDTPNWNESVNDYMDGYFHEKEGVYIHLHDMSNLIESYFLDGHCNQIKQYVIDQEGWHKESRQAALIESAPEITDIYSRYKIAKDIDCLAKATRSRPQRKSRKRVM